MEIPVILRQPWNISERSLNAFCENELESVLRAFDRAGSGNFYIVDFFRRKVIVPSPSALILCGFPKEQIEEKRLAFYQVITREEDHEWIINIFEKSFEFMFLFSEERRTDLVFAYDIKGVTPKNEERVLHHHIVPWKLCKNGNLWLVLAHAWHSDAKESGSPVAYDKKTGEQYHFIDNKFIKVEKPSLDKEDLMILKWMIASMPDKEMSELLAMPLSSFKRKKRLLFQKIGGNTSANVVYKAHLFGFI